MLKKSIKCVDQAKPHFYIHVNVLHQLNWVKVRKGGIIVPDNIYTSFRLKLEMLCILHNYLSSSLISSINMSLKNYQQYRDMTTNVRLEWFCWLFPVFLSLKWNVSNENWNNNNIRWHQQRIDTYVDESVYRSIPLQYFRLRFKKNKNQKHSSN